MKDKKLVRFDGFSYIMWTINIAIACFIWISGFSKWSGVYGMFIITISIAGWFDLLGWKRGFRQANKINRHLNTAFFMTFERYKNKEFNKEDFNKEFKKDLEITKKW